MTRLSSFGAEIPDRVKCTHPDLDNPTEGPHWDYNDKLTRERNWRIWPNGKMTPKQWPMLKRFALGIEGIEFVRERLRHGDLLAAALLKLPIEQGEAYAFLPEGVDLKEISLQEGGLSRYASGDDVRTPIIQLAEEQLRSPCNLAVAETMTISENELPDWFAARTAFPVFMARPSLIRMVDPVTRQLLPQTGVFGYLSSGNGTRERIKNLIDFSGPLPIWLVVLTSWPPDETIVPGQRVEVDFLGRLADRASHIVLGAYDDEAFVVWSRDPHEPSSLDPIGAGQTE